MKFHHYTSLILSIVCFIQTGVYGQTGKTVPDSIHIEYYPSGKKKAEIPYKNGKIKGLMTGWYESGRKLFEAPYKDGKREGVTVSFYENGKKECETLFKNDKEEGVAIEYYENGRKHFETPYKHGKREGVEKIWDENENLTTSTWKNGRGVATEEIKKVGYFQNGNKKHERYFKNGKQEGVETAWYGNGLKKYEMPYKDGKKDGVAKYWDEKGKLTTKT